MGKWGQTTFRKHSESVFCPRFSIVCPRFSKNTRERVQQDATDLCGAVCRDTNALRENLNNQGYDSKLVDETIQKTVDRNRAAGVIK